MSRIPPEPTGDETSFSIVRRPSETRARPLFLWVVWLGSFHTFLLGNVSVFVRVEGILLVVGCELESKNDEGLNGELIVCCRERGMGLKNRSNICRKTKEEQKEVLDGSNEGEVRNLEKDRVELCAKDRPTVILIFSDIDVGESSLNSNE